MSARKLVLKPILTKISVLKHLDHVPGEGLGGRRRRPKLDKSGQKLKESKVFLCQETRKTSSFCAPHGATIILSTRMILYSSRPKYITISGIGTDTGSRNLVQSQK